MVYPTTFGMVSVNSAHRRRGLGRAIVSFALTLFDSNLELRVPLLNLHYDWLFASVYEPLGFVSESEDVELFPDDSGILLDEYVGRVGFKYVVRVPDDH